MRRRFIGFYARKKFWMLVRLSSPLKGIDGGYSCACLILFGAPVRHERLNLHRGTELTMHALAIPDSGRAMAQARATTMEGLRCKARVGGAQAANAQSSLYPKELVASCSVFCLRL